MERESDPGDVRLAELVAALSLGIDLGFDQPMEHVLRQCLIATRLAEQVGLDEQTRADVYYTSLLVNVGCHTDAHEQARWFGDDITLKADKYVHGVHGVKSAVAGLRLLGSRAETVAQRLRVGLEFAVAGHRDLDAMITHHSTMARTLGENLGLPRSTLAALDASYEQWDGKGWPGDLSGDDVPIAARLAVIGEFIEVAHRVGGLDTAKALATRQRGKQFDPHLADELAAHADILLADLDGTDAWSSVIGAEPSLTITLSDEQLDEALLAIADFIDLKSPYSLGHAGAVAELASGAATKLGMSDAEATRVRRAGLVHCFGKLGVSNSILDKPTPLSAGERERVRMIPYLTHRMLAQSSALAPLGAIAVQHAERLDGSGYPHGLSGTAISRPARILAAADAYQSLREPRPHREARSADQAAMLLRADVKEGRLASEAVEAVLASAGHRVPRRRVGPAGLTAREMDVLRLLARGMTTRAIAERLVISRKTVANHVEHIYTKIGASNRAAAALFATQHGLLIDEEPAQA